VLIEEAAALEEAEDAALEDGGEGLCIMEEGGTGSRGIIGHGTGTGRVVERRLQTRTMRRAAARAAVAQPVHVPFTSSASVR
jgi:hypothetical protein